VTEFCDEQINNYDGDFYATVETRRAARNAAASSQQLKIKPQTIQTKTMIEDATLLETVSDVQDDVLDSDKDIYDEFLIDDDDEAVLRQTDELQPDSVVESEAVELSVSYVVPANEIEELKESNLAEFSETALIFDDKF
jgi:hypothetical protein